MEEMGVSMVNRKLAALDNLKINLEQTGNKFVVKETSAFRTLDIEFTLRVTFEYALADGTMLSGTWTMESSVLKGTFNREDNGKVLNTNRSIVGDKLIQSYSYDGVQAKRIFKRG